MSSPSTPWSNVSLGEVCQFKYGRSLPSAQRSGGSVAVFGSNGVVGYNDESLTRGPTIIIGRKGSFGEINYSGLFCWPIDTTYYVDATSTEADLRWLYYRLSGLPLKQLNRAAAVPGLNRDDAYRLRILLPPLDEQQKIAAVLDQAEALRGKRREALAQLDELTQSIFLEMFGDPSVNPRKLATIKLGVVSTRITKGESPAWQGFDYEDEGVLFVTSENVRLGEIDLRFPKYVPIEFHRKLRRSALKKGDILVNLVGASIGRSCVFQGWYGPANVNQAVAVVTLDSAKAEISFIAALLNSQRGQEMLLGNRVEGARANISLTDLRELDILLPPLHFQSQFARRVGTAERLKTSHRAHLAELDALFASLQYRAFRGEL